MWTNRRQAIGIGIASLFTGAAAQASSFSSSSQAIKLIIPAPPGGPADMMARAMIPTMSAELGGNPIMVDNRPGGATVLGASMVAKAPPDGFTLLLTINSTHTQVPHLLAKIPYDPFKDFTPISQLFQSGVVVCAQKGLPVRDLKELVTLSQASPITAASAGIGTTGHLYIEMLNSIYGAKLIHVPYKGAAEGQRDLQAGIVQVYFDSVSSAIPFVRADKVKALAVTGTKRLEALPEVPSVVELGLDALNISGWFGIFGPGNMPEPVVAALNRAIRMAVQSPQVVRQFSPLGVELTGTSAAEFAAIVRRDHATWGKVIKDAAIKID